MKKHKRYLFIGVVLFSFVLSGCGTKLYEMTQEEEDLIVHSAAYYVAKHNIQQKDGVSAVVDPDTITIQEESEEVEGITESETELAEEVIMPSGGGEGQTADVTGVSLVEAIGHSTDLSIAYTGSYTADNYIEGAAYSVDAQTGKTFYVMQFTITNITDGDVLVDNASIGPVFKLESSGLSVKSEVTFLTTDLSTYQGTIAAGETVETILLFEVSEGSVAEITAPVLKITIDNETKNVKL